MSADLHPATAAVAAPRASAINLHGPVLLRDMSVLHNYVNSAAAAGQTPHLEDLLGTQLAMMLIRQLRQQPGMRAPGLTLESEFWQAMVGLGGELARTAVEAMQAKLEAIERLAGSDPHDMAKAILARWEQEREEVKA